MAVPDEPVPCYRFKSARSSFFIPRSLKTAYPAAPLTTALVWFGFIKAQKCVLGHFLDLLLLLFFLVLAPRAASAHAMTRRMSLGVLIPLSGVLFTILDLFFDHFASL